MAPKLEEGHLSYLEGSGWGYTFSDDTVQTLNAPRYNCVKLTLAGREPRLQEMSIGSNVGVQCVCVSEETWKS